MNVCSHVGKYLGEERQGGEIGWMTTLKETSSFQNGCTTLHQCPKWLYHFTPTKSMSPLLHIPADTQHYQTILTILGRVKYLTMALSDISLTANNAECFSLCL